MKPRTLEGRVRDVVDSGDSVVETEAGIVMVRGGLPGERVRLRSDVKRSGVLHGELLEVLDRSPARVSPACPVVDRCGGCPLMALELSAQRELKMARLARAIGVDIPIELDTAGPALGYRRRARLAFRRVSQRSLVGYRQGAASTIVDVERCPVLDPALEAALGLIREHLGPVLEGSGEIELTARDDDRVVVGIACDRPVGPPVYAAAEALASRAPVSGVSLAIEGGVPARFGDPSGSARGADGRVLHAPPDAFLQANAAVNERLAERVVALACPPETEVRVLELYAGYGNFSVGLAARASAFWAVEGNPAAADACRKNLAERGFAHARVLARDVAQFEPAERADVVVLDPPRAGAKRLAEIVQAARARRVVYVSCHMTTLARDVKALALLGFRADRACALDMFPQTAHVEAVVHLRLPETQSKM